MSTSIEQKQHLIGALQLNKANPPHRAQTTTYSIKQKTKAEAKHKTGALTNKPKNIPLTYQKNPNQKTLQYTYLFNLPKQTKRPFNTPIPLS